MQSTITLTERYNLPLNNATAKQQIMERGMKTMYKLRIHSGGGTVYDFMCGLTEEEAIEIGNGYGWSFTDENGFCWDMDYDEER